MKDFIGQPLEVGDTVAVTEPSYRNLVKAEVIRFTPKRVVLQMDKNNTYTTPPDFVIKIPKQGDRNV